MWTRPSPHSAQLKLGSFGPAHITHLTFDLCSQPSPIHLSFISPHLYGSTFSAQPVLTTIQTTYSPSNSQASGHFSTTQSVQPTLSQLQNQPSPYSVHRTTSPAHTQATTESAQPILSPPYNQSSPHSGNYRISPACTQSTAQSVQPTLRQPNIRPSPLQSTKLSAQPPLSPPQYCISPMDSQSTKHSA